jgi:hypothetical protein
VSAENADQNKYGWIVADFLRWKMLFHRAGPKQLQVSATLGFHTVFLFWLRPAHNCFFQTWLSCLDIPTFLAGIEGVDMVNDGTVDKILGDQKDDIIPIPNDNVGFATAFRKSLAMSARLAASRKTTLVVMVFAPITPEQDICVDLGPMRFYLTTERLLETIIDAVGNLQLPVLLVTPSPFTGGWLCRPSFLNPSSYPSPDKMLRILAKTCGAAFADSFTRSFTDRSTPFMTEAQRKMVRFDNPMPLRASVLQVGCLHRFQRQIHESLEHRLSVSAQDHSFILEPEATRDTSNFSDSWTDYGPRHGRSMEVWAEHWPIPRPTVNDANRFEFLGEAFGGTKESQFFHLKYLATIELETCPGDWNRHVGGTCREMFTSFSQGLMPGEDDVKRVFDAIEFRASSMILAQATAKAFDLPLPDSAKCRYWHDKIDGVSDEYYSRLQYGFGLAVPLFGQVAMLPSEKRHDYKNVQCLRPARWLAAASALRFNSREDINKFMSSDVARFIAKLRDTQRKLLLEDQAVRRKALNWVAALGLGGEVQLSPTRTAPSEAEAVQPTKDVGFLGSNSQPTSASTAVLDAQAAPWPIHAGEGETSGSSKLPSTLEHMIAEWNERDAMKKPVQQADPQPSTNNAPQEPRNPDSATIPSSGAKIGAKVAGNESASGTADAHPQNCSHMSFQPGDTDGEVDGRPVSKGSSSPGPPVPVAPAVATSRNDEAAPSRVLRDGTGSCEKAANSSSAISDQKKLDNDEASSLKSAENHVVSEETGKHEPLALSTAEHPAQPPSRHGNTESAATTPAGLLSGYLDGRLSTLVQLLRTTANLMEQELAKQSAGSQSETEAAESISNSVEVKGTAQEIAGTASMEPPAAAWESAQGDGASLERVETGTEQTVATLSDSLGVAAEATTARSESDLLDFDVESVNIYDATPPRSPVVGRRAIMQDSGDCTENNKKTDAAQESEARDGASDAPADAPADAWAQAQAGLTEGDDFWARARIKW